MLRGLILVAAVALGVAGEPEPRFENDVYGHSVLVPPGWSARLSESGTTNVLSYHGGLLDRLGSPPPGQVRVVVADYGRGHCPPGTSRDAAPTRLGRRVSFEGFPDGYSVAFCLRGHSFQALVPVGRGASTARIEQARQVLASIRLMPRAREVDNIHSVRQLGRSLDGRPIRAWRIGNPKAARRALVVGCIHGDECAGLAVTHRLVNLARPIDFDMGRPAAEPGRVRAAEPRQRPRRRPQPRLSRGDAAGDADRAEADPAAAAGRDALVPPAAGGRSGVGAEPGGGARYARLAGVRYRDWEWPPGSASRWQNGIGLTSFVVELPPGELPDAVARRHADAVLRLAE